MFSKFTLIIAFSILTLSIQSNDGKIFLKALLEASFNDTYTIDIDCLGNVYDYHIDTLKRALEIENKELFTYVALETYMNIFFDTCPVNTMKLLEDTFYYFKDGHMIVRIKQCWPDIIEYIQNMGKITPESFGRTLGSIIRKLYYTTTSCYFYK